MINENIYGAADTWLNAPYVGGGRMVTKCANFTGGTGYTNSSTLGIGNNQGKTPHGDLIDRTICTVALGTESIYSHMSYYLITDTYTDDEQVTEFFYAVNDGQRSFTTQRSFYDTNHPNFWKVYTPSTPYNYSDNTIPITDLNPQKILYRLEVCPCKANGATAPYSYTQTSDGYIYISDYDNNLRNIKTDYPYIMAAQLVPYMDTSNTTTPNRSRLLAADAGFGIAINREFTSIPNDNLKINYCQFRNCGGFGLNTVPLYGYKGYFPNAYCIVLADTADITTAIVDYSTEKFVAHEYDTNFHDWLLSQAACFGVYVQAFGGTPESVALDDDSIILGIIDGQGIGHGEYTRGAANRDNDIWGWDSYNVSPYDYTKPIDPTRYDTTTVFGNNSLYNTFIQYYACSPDGLKTLCNYIYNYINNIDTSTDDITKSIVKTFYTNNPLDVIVSLKRFPFNITEYFTSGAIAPVNIRLGELITTGYGWALSGQYTVVDFGSYDCYPVFGDTFIDYAPYTYYELIIPFCGSTRIDPALFMGKTLKLKMVVDLYTGACTCYILANSLCIDSVSGNCAIDVPITGIQSADFQNSVQNAITNVKNARINTAAYNLKGNLAMGAIWTGAIGGNAFLKGGAAARVGNFISSFGTSLSNALNVGGNVASAQKAEAQNYISESKANYDLEHVQTPFNSVGSQSAANSYIEEMQARLIIYRPKFIAGWDSETYGKTVGFACMLDGVVNDFDGFTVANIDVSGINASAEEKQLIAAAFANGVYL